jgi:hypothetical protein
MRLLFPSTKKALAMARLLSSDRSSSVSVAAEAPLAEAIQQGRALARDRRRLGFMVDWLSEHSAGTQIRPSLIMQEKGSPGQDEHSSEEQQKSLKTVVNRPQTRRIRTFVAYDTQAKDLKTLP